MHRHLPARRRGRMSSRRRRRLRRPRNRASTEGVNLLCGGQQQRPLVSSCPQVFVSARPCRTLPFGASSSFATLSWRAIPGSRVTSRPGVRCSPPEREPPDACLTHWARFARPDRKACTIRVAADDSIHLEVVERWVVELEYAASHRAPSHPELWIRAPSGAFRACGSKWQVLEGGVPTLWMDQHWPRYSKFTSVEVRCRTRGADIELIANLGEFNRISVRLNAGRVLVTAAPQAQE